MKDPAADVISDVVTSCWIARLRIFAMLVAIGAGLVGQVVIAAPIISPQSPMVMVGMAPDDCNGCAGMDMSHGAMPMMAASGCGVTFCSGLPAVLAAGPVVKSIAAYGAFPPITSDFAQGVIVRPDLGPPRTTDIA